MRVIAVSTLKIFWAQNKNSEQALKSWCQEVKNISWESPNELKEQYRNASILTNKRAVFNIKDNSYRLIVDIEYRLKIIFVVWVGIHKEYDKIDAKFIKYVKANKK